MSIFTVFLFPSCVRKRNAEERFADVYLDGEMGEENYGADGKPISCPELVDDLMQPRPVCFHIPTFVLYDQQSN